jgi:hypothetical protein
MVHFADNWAKRLVPARNFSQSESAQSMERIAALLVTESAELWVNHDKEQSAGILKAPRYVE